MGLCLCMAELPLLGSKKKEKVRKEYFPRSLVRLGSEGPMPTFKVLFLILRNAELNASSLFNIEVRLNYPCRLITIFLVKHIVQSCF